MVLVGGMDTVRKPGGGNMSEKSSWLSDDTVSSSSEDMSSSGCRDVMCVQRIYAYSPQRGSASCIHLSNSSCKTWAGRFPSTNRVLSCTEKEVKEGRSSSRVNRWSLASNLLIESDQIRDMTPVGL